MGEEVGRDVGCPDGESVGCVVGLAGLRVGWEVGCSDGKLDGIKVG